MSVVALFRAPSLLTHPGLSEGVKQQVKTADWQTFIVAMTVLIGGGLMLVLPSVTSDVKLADAGFIGAVVSYFFGRQQTLASAAATVAAQQTDPSKPAV